MTVSFWLKTATHFLQSKAITTARLDCLVLLEDTLRLERTQLLAEPTTEMTGPQVAHLQKLLSRRSRHEPLAYIRGRSEFYGRDFIVSPAVLVPRPESETMIELLKGLELFSPSDASKQATADTSEPALPSGLKRNDVGTRRLKIADVGAGSGALGITAALELKNCNVDLLDIDKAALKVAQLNVDKFATRNLVICSDLLEQAPDSYDILLSNLPYVPDNYAINRAATYEPTIALFAGHDGLDCYRRLFVQIAISQKCPLFILTESLPAQHATLRVIAAENGYTLAQTDDFIQLFSRRAH